MKTWNLSEPFPPNGQEKAWGDLIRLWEIDKNYNEEMDSLIRLSSTEGALSPLQKGVAMRAPHEKYLHTAEENSPKTAYYRDIKGLQKMYQMCQELLQQLLNIESSKNILPDFFSGMHVMECLINAFSSIFDLVLSIDPIHGGHPNTVKMVKKLGRKHSFLPFDSFRHVVGVYALDPHLNPALIILDHSNILHPHPNIAMIKKVYPNAIVVFDISQVMAGVMAGLFPNPLHEGADAIIGSTHKSLNGPQKAIFATNDLSLLKRMESLKDIWVSSNHIDNIEVLCACLIEFKQFGKQYADQLVRNANVLGKELMKQGIEIYTCFSTTGDDFLTHTQQVYVDLKGTQSIEKSIQELYQAGIVVHKLYLSKGGFHQQGGEGLRLGVTEVTRFGMREKEMEEIASLMAAALLKKENPMKVKERSTCLRKKFSKIHYCFDVELSVLN